jgi:hypothetical protein
MREIFFSPRVNVNTSFFKQRLNRIVESERTMRNREKNRTSSEAFLSTTYGSQNRQSKKSYPLISGTEFCSNGMSDEQPVSAINSAFAFVPL